MKVSQILFLACAFASAVQATAPKFNSPSPSGGQRGTEMELRLNGTRLEDIQEIIFYSPGIEVVKIDSAKTNAVKATIRIAKDCRLGEHLVRLRCATGVSDVRTFYVGAYPNLAEVEPNNDLAKPQKIAMNVTVSGNIAQEDVDYFQIEARKGERISAEVEGMRLGRGVFDPYLAIHDVSGALLAASDDSSLLMQDGFITMTAPKDGSYIIQLRETSYGGGSEFIYRLHIGNFPRPSAVYPAGGKTGDILFGRFIDEKSEVTQELNLPATPQEKFGVTAERDGQFAPSPNWIRVSPFANVLEASPNQDREHATPADMLPPVALNGIISKKGEADWFRFKAKKGQALDVNVYARRLRSPLDSVLEIFDTEGKSIAANDDAAGADSVLKFTAAADGNYFLRVKDHLNQGGVDYVYRVELTPQQPGVSLSIPQVARNDSQTRQYIAVPKGNRFATMISAKRANYTGDLTFGMDGLPAGVTLQADTMTSKVDAMPVVFEATSDAIVGGKLLDLVAKPASATADFQSKYRHEVELVQGPNNTSYYGTHEDKLYVAVVKDVPFKIRIVEPKVPLVQSGSMDLKVVAERKAGFDDPITVKMMWNPPGVGSLPDVTIPNGQTSVDYHVNATAEAQPHSWKIAVLGSATINGGTVWVSSQLTKLDIGEPFLVGKIETLSAEPGQTVKLVCKLEQRQAFDGKASVKLLGLPDKVTTSDAQIGKDDKEVVFNLNVDPKCPLGSHKALFCNVAIKKNGELIPQSVGSGGILRIVPPKKVVATATTPKAAKAK